MPTHVTVLRVFVASPGEVKEEREIAEEVIRELNTTWLLPQGILLDLLKWETNAFPGIGNYSQEVTNTQIGDDYDIFIGIMWTRFGTATAVAESGTEEEFLRAYARFKEEPCSMRIMFYFKETPISPNLIDIAQLHKVSGFKEQLGDMGGLWWPYSTLEEFTQLIRIHLSRQVQDWQKGWQGPANVVQEMPESALAVASEVASEANPRFDEDGFLEYVERAYEGFDGTTYSLNRMTEVIQELTERMAERTAELPAVGPLTSIESIRAAKRVVNKTAEDLQNFVARMRAEIPIFAEYYRSAIDSTTQAALLTPDFGGDAMKEVAPVLRQIRDLRKSIEGALEMTRSFRDMFVGWPRATGEIKRARQDAIAVLDTLLSEFESSFRLSCEAEQVLAELVGDRKPLSEGHVEE